MIEDPILVGMQKCKRYLIVQKIEEKLRKDDIKSRKLQEILKIIQNLDSRRAIQHVDKVLVRMIKKNNFFKSQMFYFYIDNKDFRNYLKKLFFETVHKKR